jgi:hypothetical protein
METQAPHELFTHIRIVMGMVIGLGIARLLTGVAGLIQHPGRHQASLLHLLWVGSILIELVLFWWWEFELSRITHWSLGAFLFLIGYAIVLYLLAALLFPDNINEYPSYEAFFLRRRLWFFSLFAATFLFDIVDTLIKGADYFDRVNQDYLIQVPIGLAICAAACIFTDRRVHIGIVLVHLSYQGYWISRTV